MIKLTNMSGLKIAGLCIAAVVFIAATAAYEYTVWTECRQTNSFLYCVRMMSR